MKNILKKICNVVMLLTVILTLGTSTVTFADEKNSVESTNTSTSTPASGTALNPNDLFHSFKYKEGTAPTDSKIGYVDKIAAGTQGSWGQILGNATKLILAVTGTLALVSFTYAGIMFVTARGSEDHLKKAKDQIFLSILALAIIAASYAFVLGISQLKFG